MVLTQIKTVLAATGTDDPAVKLVIVAFAAVVPLAVAVIAVSS